MDSDKNFQSQVYQLTRRTRPSPQGRQVKKSSPTRYKPDSLVDQGRGSGFISGDNDEEPGFPFNFSHRRPSQSIQGFPRSRSLGDDRCLVLTDKGFGHKSNSADVILMLNIVKADRETRRATIKRDSKKGAPREGRAERPALFKPVYLVGADEKACWRRSPVSGRT